MGKPLHVLVPLDGSEQSETILTPVAELYEAMPCEVTLLHVRRPDAAAIPFPVGDGAWVPHAVTADADLFPAKDYLLQARERLKLRVKGKVDTLETTGDVEECIARVAAERNADIVALSPHGRGGRMGWLLGSTAYTLVRKCSQPVLSFRCPPASQSPAYGTLLERILIACDGSPLGEKVVSLVAGLAHPRKSRITLLYVTHPGDGKPEGDPAQHEALKAAYDKLTGLGFQVRCELFPGRSIPEAIITRARYVDATLVAIASRGKGMLAHFALGTTAYDVIRKSMRPTLIVR